MGQQHGRVRQQVSLESAHSQDSRMCYLTSSEVSERELSLKFYYSNPIEVMPNLVKKWLACLVVFRFTLSAVRCGIRLEFISTS